MRVASYKDLISQYKKIDNNGKSYYLANAVINARAILKALTEIDGREEVILTNKTACGLIIKIGKTEYLLSDNCRWDISVLLDIANANGKYALLKTEKQLCYLPDGRIKTYIGTDGKRHKAWQNSTHILIL